MRYNSDTERRINIDEIAAQCRAAILKAPSTPVAPPCSYNDVLQFARWENDILICAA